MNTRITSLLAGLCLMLLAAPAVAQINGGFEAREFHVVVDPDGVAIHAATVWFDDTQMESIWVAENKIDAADMAYGIKLEDQGTSIVPSHLSASYSSTTLTSTTTYTDVHAYERPSDNEIDIVMVLDLEGSCTVDCYIDALDFLMVDDLKTDLGNPTLSTYEFDYYSSFDGLSGDTVEDHAAQ